MGIELMNENEPSRRAEPTHRMPTVDGSVRGSESNEATSIRRKPLYGSTSRWGQVNISKLKKTVEPTFKMVPDSTPDLRLIKAIFFDSMKARCGSRSYKALSADGRTLMRINNEIHRKVKNILPERYRFILQLSLVEDYNQDFSLSSSFLWDDRFDTYVTAEFRTNTFILVTVCHLVYME